MQRERENKEKERENGKREAGRRKEDATTVLYSKRVPNQERVVNKRDTQ